MFIALNYSLPLEGKVSGGQEVQLGSMLFIASLMNLQSHHCTTFFITEDQLLTAASCLEEFYDEKKMNVFRDYYIRVRDINDPKRDYKLEQVEIHESYKFTTESKIHNIGLVQVH